MSTPRTDGRSQRKLSWALATSVGSRCTEPVCTALYVGGLSRVSTWDDSNVSMVFYGDLSLVYIEITCIGKKCSNVKLRVAFAHICPLTVGTSLHRSSKCGPTLPRRLPRSHFKQNESNEISRRDRARDNCFTASRYMGSFND